MAGYLCVDLLPSSVTTAELSALVAPCSGVKRCRIPTDRNGGSLGFGFIETTSRAEAERILQQLDGTPIRGRSIRCRDSMRTKIADGVMRNGFWNHFAAEMVPETLSVLLQRTQIAEQRIQIPVGEHGLIERRHGANTVADLETDVESR
jgi:hypothetical protein